MANERNFFVSINFGKFITNCHLEPVTKWESLKTRNKNEFDEWLFGKRSRSIADRIKIVIKKKKRRKRID